LFFELGFEFVEDFFDIPTVFVEQDECPGREAHFIDEGAVFCSVGRVHVDDLTRGLKKEVGQT